MSYLPGGLASGSVSYHACFHDTPEGLQTHVYAPLGLDIQARWTVGGRLAGEPILPEEPDVDLNLPKHGLYIREDVQMRCSSLLIGFVKKTFKDSHASLVIFIGRRIARRFAGESLDHQGVQINHRQMIMVHVQHTLPGDPPWERCNRCEYGSLWHREALDRTVHLFQIGVSSKFSQARITGGGCCTR